MNVLILLLEIHRYAQSVEALKAAIHFYPCGQPDTDGHDDKRWLRMIHYSDCLELSTFNQSVGKFLSSADLSSANLRSADLRSANLRSADLIRANLNEIRWDGATHWAGAQGLHAALNVPKSLAQTPRFKAAVVLSQGMDGGKQGNVLAAIQAYQDAQTIDTGLEIDAEIWDLLCWVGVLYNQAAEILFASEKATHSDPDWPIYRDTRGLVRALTGDLQGAIDDFEFVTKKLSTSGYASSHRSLHYGADEQQVWLEALRLGQNPFTPEVLEALRKKAGLGNDGAASEAGEENG